MNRRRFLGGLAFAPVGIALGKRASDYRPILASARDVVPTVARDYVAEARMVASLYQHGVISQAEARAFFGLPE